MSFDIGDTIMFDFDGKKIKSFVCTVTTPIVTERYGVARERYGIIYIRKNWKIIDRNILHGHAIGNEWLYFDEDDFTYNQRTIRMVLIEKTIL